MCRPRYKYLYSYYAPTPVSEMTYTVSSGTSGEWRDDSGYNLTWSVWRMIVHNSTKKLQILAVDTT